MDKKKEQNAINESVNRIVTMLCKEQGIMKKELAERLGTSDISLSFTLSPNCNTITTKKLVEIATALGRKVIIGIMSDEEIATLSEKKVHEHTTANDTFICPCCGKKFKLVPCEDEEEVVVEETPHPIMKNIVICEPMEGDKEARQKMVQKMLESRKANKANKENK